MPRYSIQGVVAADCHIGEIDAPTAKEAIERAWSELECGSPNVCHHCAGKLNVGDVYKLIAENVSDMKDVAESD